MTEQGRLKWRPNSATDDYLYAGTHGGVEFSLYKLPLGGVSFSAKTEDVDLCLEGRGEMCTTLPDSDPLWQAVQEQCAPARRKQRTALSRRLRELAVATEQEGS